MGPMIRLLEAAHSRLPATFVLFLGALNRWVSTGALRLNTGTLY
jgi:hypothetical protein